MMISSNPKYLNISLIAVLVICYVGGGIFLYKKYLSYDEADCGVKLKYCPDGSKVMVDNETCILPTCPENKTIDNNFTIRKTEAENLQNSSLFFEDEKGLIKRKCKIPFKYCPDGSKVVANEKNCVFPACPEKGNIIASGCINEVIDLKNMEIVPLEVVADSRCPVDVQCIQAGALSLKVELADGVWNNIVTIKSGEEIQFSGKVISFVDVKPEKNSKIDIEPSDYEFYFLVQSFDEYNEQKKINNFK